MEITIEQIKTLIVESEERTKKELRQEMQQMEQRLKRELKQELGQEIKEVKQEFSNFRHDIIRWMVGLFIGSAVLVISVGALYTGAVTIFAHSLQYAAPPAVSAPQTPARTN